MAGARQLFIDLLARDKTGSGTKSASKNLDDVAESAETAAKATDKLGNKADESEGQVQRLGKSSRTAAEHVEHLDREIKLCERELQKLAVAFAEAETAADRADLSKGIRNTRAELAKLKQNKNVLKDIIPDEPEVKKLSKNLFEGFGEGLSALKGPALAALAPLLGSVASAGIIGAAGAGGVIGGVLLASKDPRVKAAGSELGHNLLGQLEKDADVFVDPLLKNITKVEMAFSAENGRIKDIFAKSSGFLDPLVDGSIRGVNGILKGVDSLVTKGKPVMDELGRTFATIGNATGHALDTVAGGSKAAAAGLAQFSDGLGTVIEGTGYAIRGLTELYGILHKPDESFNNFLTKWITGTTEAAAKTGVASTVSGTFAEVQKKVGGAVDGATGSVHAEVNALEALNNRLKAATDPTFALIDAQTQLREAQKGVNDAIKTHGRNSPEYEAALRKQALAALALESAAGQVAATSNGKLDPALRATLQAAGFTKTEIADLEKQFKNAKRAADAFEGNYKVKVTPSGLVQTFEQINGLRYAISQLPSGKTIRVRVSVTGEERLDNLGHRLGGYRAAGGPVTAGKAYIVGEKRPEVFVPNQSGTIIPSISQFTGGGGGGMVGGGGQVATLGFAPNADSIMASAFLKVLRVNSAFRAEVKKLVNP